MKTMRMDLHCHFDGSVTLDFLRDALKARGIVMDDESLAGRVQVREDCPSLRDYLACFDLTIACLQTRDNLRQAAKDMALMAAEDQVVYMETRFAPNSFTHQGLSIDDILESIKEGLDMAREECGIQVRMILCAMRHHSAEENKKVIYAAREWLGSGVVACDLAGDEKGFPLQQSLEVFREARRLGVPYTIHAGECLNPEEVRMAIDIGASRIGHGIAMRGHEELKKMCRDRRIGVELCPTSNFQTKAVTSWAEYPLLEFLSSGVPVSINTDNRLMSCTSMEKEMKKVDEALHLTEERWKIIRENTIEMSFGEDSLKHRLWELNKSQ